VRSNVIKKINNNNHAVFEKLHQAWTLQDIFLKRFCFNCSSLPVLYLL